MVAAHSVEQPRVVQGGMKQSMRIFAFGWGGGLAVGKRQDTI